MGPGEKATCPASLTLPYAQARGDSGRHHVAPRYSAARPRPIFATYPSLSAVVICEEKNAICLLTPCLPLVCADPRNTRFVACLPYCNA